MKKLLNGGDYLCLPLCLTNIVKYDFALFTYNVGDFL